MREMSTVTYRCPRLTCKVYVFHQFKVLALIIIIIIIVDIIRKTSQLGGGLYEVRVRLRTGSICDRFCGCSVPDRIVFNIAFLLAQLFLRLPFHDIDASSLCFILSHLDIHGISVTTV